MKNQNSSNYHRPAIFVRLVNRVTTAPAGTSNKTAF